MGNSALLVMWIAASSIGAAIPESEIELQNAVFQRLWNDNFVWRFSDLPTQGSVPKERIPYSGHIYLDKDGGTSAALRKYDLAFNDDSLPATMWESSDTAEARRRRVISHGRFGRTRFFAVNDWYGHCNGWSAAAIRHAEPQHSVTVHGVEFTPAEIKGLLAEVYMYNQHEILAGFEEPLNPGTFHAVLANWLGRGSHAVVMDSDPGEEKWNYPIYAFASSSVQRSPREVEVRTNFFYAKDTPDREYDQSPRNHEMKSFHYTLYLNRRGEISGGYYYSDSDKIDFLWIPLQAHQSGEEGNEAGNPHVDVAQVLDIWRRSVSRETRRQWLIVDPGEKDRAVEVPDPNRILPRNILIVAPQLPVEPIARHEVDAPQSDVTDLANITPAEAQDRSSEEVSEPSIAARNAEDGPTDIHEFPGASVTIAPVAEPATDVPARTQPTAAPETGLSDAEILSILNQAANQAGPSN